MTKTNAKGKAKAKKPADQSAKQRPKTPVIEGAPGADEPMDIAQVREKIGNLVGESAKDIVAKVIDVAKTTGQLASAKYLFETVGLYPAGEQVAGEPKEDSLAQILLKRMGLSVEPVKGEEDKIAAGLAAGKKNTGCQNIPIAVGEGVTGPRGEGEQPAQPETTGRREVGEDTVE
jgi:hypothetical protein